MEATPLQDFLSAEQAADDLVAELTRLRDEAARYSGAALLLEQTQAALAELIEKATASAQGLQGVVEALGRIDTPQLLKRLGELGEQLSAQQDEGRETRAAVSALSDRVAATAAAVQQSVTQLAGELAARVQDCNVAVAKVGKAALWASVLAGLSFLTALALVLVRLG